MALVRSYENGLHTVMVDGDTNVLELQELFREIARTDLNDPFPRVLITDEGSPFAPSIADIRTIVGLWRELWSDSGVRIALIVARELHYGLGRVFEAFAGASNISFRVFRPGGEAAARDWLAPETEA